PGNLAFDADLKRRNAEWGIRRREAVEAEARTVGLELRERVAMPANNLLLVFGGGESSIPRD
ncbi:SAM-dependent methyltransferase, partial [Rubrivivax gelatinosus]|nr:SAM-dependent methyltransferase [Rubrivivax gelatinosus]